MVPNVFLAALLLIASCFRIRRRSVDQDKLQGLVGNLHDKSSTPDFQQMIVNLVLTTEMPTNKSDLAAIFVAILTNDFINKEEVLNTTPLTRGHYLKYLQTAEPGTHFLTAKVAKLFGSKTAMCFAEFASKTQQNFEMLGTINEMAATVQFVSNSSVALGVAQRFVNILTEDFTNNVEVIDIDSSRLTKPQLVKYYKEYSIPYAEQKAESLFAGDSTMPFAQFAKTSVEEDRKMQDMIDTWADKVQWAKPGAKEGIVVPKGLVRRLPTIPWRWPQSGLTLAASKAADFFLSVVTKGFSNMNVNASPTVTKSQLVEYHKELGDADAEEQAEELWEKLGGNPPSVEFAQFSEALKGP